MPTFILSRLVSFRPTVHEKPKKKIHTYNHDVSLCTILVSESVILSLCPRSSCVAGLDSVSVLVVFHLRCISYPTPIQFAIQVLVELGFPLSKPYLATLRLPCSHPPATYVHPRPLPSIFTPYILVFEEVSHFGNPISVSFSKMAITFRSKLETRQKCTF